jgi:hypothetical protein
MSTRSRIGIKLKDGKVRSVYCHHDGYLEWMGRQLLEHYNSEAKAGDLIALGDLSSVHPQVNPTPGVHHSYDAPQPGVTVAYGRDRGEQSPATEHADEVGFLSAAEEYSYLWKNDRWHVWCHHEGSLIQGGELTAELVAETLTS